MEIIADLKKFRDELQDGEIINNWDAIAELSFIIDKYSPKEEKDYYCSINKVDKAIKCDKQCENCKNEEK